MDKLKDWEVLKTCIDLAIKNGWGESWYKGAEVMVGEESLEIYFLTDKDDPEHSTWMTLPFLLFDHSFAKALFGTEIEEWNYLEDEAWIWGLKHLVVAEDRVDYLRQWLKEQDNE